MKIMRENHITESKRNLHFGLLWQVWVDSVAPFWSDQIYQSIILSRPCEILNLGICFDHGNINQAKRRRGSSDGAVMYEERCPIAPWREGLSRWLCTSFFATRGGSNKKHTMDTKNNCQLPGPKFKINQNQRMCLLFCPTLWDALWQGPHPYPVLKFSCKSPLQYRQFTKCAVCIASEASVSWHSNVSDKTGATSSGFRLETWGQDWTLPCPMSSLCRPLAHERQRCSKLVQRPANCPDSRMLVKFGHLKVHDTNRGADWNNCFGRFPLDQSHSKPFQVSFRLQLQSGRQLWTSQSDSRWLPKWTLRMAVYIDNMILMWILYVVLLIC